jgi:predicted PurR-regulated permease PerM
MPDGSQIGVTAPLTEAEKQRFGAKDDTPPPIPVSLTQEHAGPDPTAPVRVSPTTADWATIGLFLIAAAAAFIYAQAVLMPIVLAFLLAITFSPVRRAMEKLRVPAGITAALITLGLLAATLGAVAGVSAPLSDYVANAPEYLREAEGKLRAVSETVEKVSEVGESVEIAAEQTDDVQTVEMREPGFVAKMATVAPFVFAQIVLTLALLYFILASGDMFYEKIVHNTPTFRDKRRAVRIFRDIETKLSRYFFTITVINAGLGLAIALAMWAMGMPHPYLFGLFAFVFNYVPYIGAVLGVGLATVIGIITYDQVSTALLVGFVYFFLTSFEGQFVTPYAVGKSLKLNTVVVFIAVAFWGWMWSVIGMIVAMPILIALRAFAEHIPKLNGLGDFLSARHAEVEAVEDEPKAAAARAL